MGLAAATSVMGLAVVLPRLSDWEVSVTPLTPERAAATGLRVLGWAPLRAAWEPRVGPGSLAALALAALALLYAGRFASRWPWPRMLAMTFVMTVAWMTSLATVDGLAGIGRVLDTTPEYLPTAREVTDLPTLLRTFIDRIPEGAPERWPVHISGHPPGALLLFVLLVAVGLGSGLAAGMTVLLIAATTPVAVLATLRLLGAEPAARTVAPLLVFGPAAIWMAVSADGLFAAMSAWGLCCLAASATRQRWWSTALWGIAAGVVLGYCAMLSYGLPLLSVLAMAILLVARNFRPLLWALGAALLLVLSFAAAGFSWWEAFPVLRERYWDGIAQRRPASYWLWGNFAAFCFSAGPLAGVAAATTVSRLRYNGRPPASNEAVVNPSSGWQEGDCTTPLCVTERVVVLLGCAAVVTLVVADLSRMSKAEVERIWLPFVPWLLVGCALLPIRWQRPGLALQVGFALTVQHLLFTQW